MKKIGFILFIITVLTLSLFSLSSCSNEKIGTLTGVWVIFSDTNTDGDPVDIFNEDSLTVFQSVDEDDTNKKVANAHDDFKNVTANFDVKPSEISAEITATKKYVRIVKVYKKNDGKHYADFESAVFYEVTSTKTYSIEDSFKGDILNSFTIKIIKP